MGRWFEEGIQGGFAIRFEPGRLVSVMDGMVQRDLVARWSRRGDGWAAPAVSGGDIFTVQPDPGGVRFCERSTCYTLRSADDSAALDAVLESDQGGDAAPRDVPENVRELARAQRPTIRAGIEGRNTGEGVMAMESVLEAWSPVGHRKQTVIELFGEPTEEAEDALVYRFDSGLGGWEWQLSLDDENVSDVERQSLE